MMNDNASFFAAMGVFVFVAVIVGIILYVFMALGMQSMVKKLNIENPWLAWIPLVNVYLIGKIAGDQITIFNKTIRKLGLVLLVGGFCATILWFVPVVNLFALIAYSVIYYVALYKNYRIFTEDSAVLFIIVSIIFDAIIPFFLFFSSKNEPNLTIFNEGKPGGFTEVPSEDKIEG